MTLATRSRRSAPSEDNPRRDSPMDIRVLLVDDQPAVAAGLGSTFAGSGIRIDQAIRTKDDVVASFKSTSPSAVVIDLPYGGQLLGLDKLGALREQAREARIVIYSDTATGKAIAGAYKAGANAYVLKSSPLAELVFAIKTVCGSSEDRPVYFPPDIAQILCVLAVFGDNSPRVILDDREFEVFIGLARGETNDKIADRLGLALRTIGYTRRAVFQKLGIQLQTDCVRLALRYDLLQP